MVVPFMFFDTNGLPIAVFLAETEQEAIRLFERLYRNKWQNLQTEGCSVQKESDVPSEYWDKIADKKKKPTSTQIPASIASLRAKELLAKRKASLEATKMPSTIN